MTERYAKRMAQLVARLDDRLLESVDRLVADGVVTSLVPSRSGWWNSISSDPLTFVAVDKSREPA